MITGFVALSDVAPSVHWKQKVNFPACLCNVGLSMADLLEVALHSQSVHLYEGRNSESFSFCINCAFVFRTCNRV